MIPHVALQIVNKWKKMRSCFVDPGRKIAPHRQVKVFSVVKYSLLQNILEFKQIIQFLGLRTN